MKTTIILMRHGRTAWNRENRFRGRANIELNETGIKEAEITAQYIAANWEPDAVYCSPLRRARQTAERIAEPFMLHERSHPGLLDIDYGVWEGLTPDEVRDKHWHKALDAWYHRPQDAPIPGGEPLQTVRLRALGALNEIVERHRDGTVIIVAHTVVNRLIMLGIFNIGNEYFWHLEQDTCALNLLEYDGDHYTLVRMNDTFHLTVLDKEKKKFILNFLMKKL